MTPPRRPPDRRELEALLAKLETVAERRGSQPARRGAVTGATDIAILRALVARAIEEDGQADTGDDDDPEAWDGPEPWDEPDSWGHFRPSKPIRVEGGLRARSRKGVIGSTWWSQRFLAAIEAVMVGGRLGRGRTYARQGQVLQLDVRPGVIEARVQGSRSTPYRVRLALPVVPPEDWDAIVVALGASAGYAARMLAGELPHEVEDVFATEGASLFPGPLARLTTDCSCPDWSNPCKHVAAVCYLAAELFDRDPFAVLAWRGRDRDAILGGLRALRARQPGAPAPADADGAPAHRAPPLEACVLGYWKAGPELGRVSIRPEAAQVPGALLRQVATGVLEVHGRDVGELLAPAYAEMAAAAARRAMVDGPPAPPGATRRPARGSGRARR